ncbi:hypothetical protein [Actinoalloteichus caeruleus]|uniref:DUF892 family protein n=1 Tax=Actinoalloteichus caeruleus DSM 43889 TaxID=1120930 RepID=A0ABT1JIP2_ACTCY|nr:hypothetical protein [Actinoalloteichus caeruleus]MCP2331631.1 hypothetical protein [Actinoalloteichus caeruleus DSM 43889]
MTERSDQPAPPDQRSRLLAIYLNDHLAGATAAVELARRLAKAEVSSPDGPELDRLADEMAEDRARLADAMRLLDVEVAHYKTWALWAAEKAGRLKLNGQLRGRSPLSTVVELEGLLLVVTSLASAWRTLRAVAEDAGPAGAGPGTERLDALLRRSLDQAARLERLREAAVTRVFGTATAQERRR